MASKRLELIKLLLAEAEEFLMKGDAVQSSEKLYKAAEECVKALSEIFELEEVKAAEERGRWTVTLLEKAVRKLTDKLGMEVQLGWDAASHLHVWGFHEAKLDREDVERRMPIVKRLVELLERQLTMNANPEGSTS
ncbi:MAG: PaREP1 family protein [Thermofilaceae archaeon]